MNKIIYIIFLICCLIASGKTQATNISYTISGFIEDSNHNQLSDASVFISDSLNSINYTSFSLSNENGHFSLSTFKKKCTLNIQYLGFKPYKNDIYFEKDSILDLGKIIMKQDTLELQTIVIQGKALSVRTQADGFSINVNELKKSSNNVWDLLQRLPNISTNGDYLKVTGKDNVIVQIGNVIIRVPASEIINVLKNYDAQLINKVEVLMQPPLRYDPDGNTALIKLHTSSIFKEYMGGLIGTELMQGEHNNYRYGIYGSLLYNRKKIFLSLSPSYNNNGSYFSEKSTYDYIDSKYQLYTPSKGNSSYLGLNMTFQYQYNNTDYIGVTSNINQRKIDNNFKSYEYYTPEIISVNDAYSANSYFVKKPKINTTIYLEHSFGEHKNKLWIETSYYNYSEKSTYDYQSYHSNNDTLFFTYLDNDNLNTSGFYINNDYSFFIDDNNKYIIDTGIKTFINNTTKDRKHDQSMKTNENETFQQENSITVREYNIIPYISSTFRFSKEWWLRLKITPYITARRLKENYISHPYKHFINWLPSIHSSFIPNNSHKLFININSSIKQPRFDQLNPFEWRISQIKYYRGNINLKPELNYSYNLGYTYNGILSFSTNINHSQNLITPVSIYENEKIYTQTDNAQNKIFYGINASYYFNRLSWINFSFNTYFGYSKYSSLLPEFTDNTTSTEWGIDGYLDFVFNKSRTFSGFLSGNYIGKRETTVSSIQPGYGINAGISYYMLNRKLAISLSGIDIISSRHKGYSKQKDCIITFNNRYTYPTLYLSVSYKFSNIKDKTTRRQIGTREIDSRF